MHCHPTSEPWIPHEQVEAAVAGVGESVAEVERSQYAVEPQVEATGGDGIAETDIT